VRTQQNIGKHFTNEMQPDSGKLLALVHRSEQAQMLFEPSAIKISRINQSNTITRAEPL
jgi:hypothetical protein